jgi:hypothetical protein
LNLQKAFETQQDRPWLAFKRDGRCAARFSKEKCLIGKIFGEFPNCRVGFGRLSKALGAAPRNLIGARDLNSLVLKSFLQIQ